MKSINLRRRLAGTAITALVVGAGCLAAAPSAAAKGNGITIDTVSLHKSDVQVKVTYSCDPGLGQEIMANATALGPDSPGAGIAVGIVKTNDVICDYANHTAIVTLHAAAGTHFAKGDKVKVAVFVGNDESVSADQTVVTVL
ncbi:hypothetical protein ACFY0F_25970 [Streptomyces sp. NPDC001544]|uniref:hypothetical protein n=1 Tax=Streptomyces sp. NPDC001544 TaxID=3364584 RepID=UPI0036C4405B